jgi:hypothetical protein
MVHAMILRAFALVVLACGFGSAAIVACASDVPPEGFSDPNGRDPNGDPVFGFGDSGSDVKVCSNLECKVASCSGSQDTTVTGTVYAPNGTLPIYNAIVYVPNTEVQPFTKGVSCDQCGSVASGSPVAITLSDSSGNFKLEKVPVGTNIPLVIQVGKWRRKVVLPEVKKCEENKLTDKDMTRLPKTRAEGDIPQIAVTTGGCDNLGCMLPKLGIPTEIGTEADGDSKAVHVYAPKTIWNDLNKLKKYDLAVFSCECSERPDTKGPVAFQAVTDYLAAGGRIFTTDFQYTWYKQSSDPALSTVSNITGGAPPAGKQLYLNDTFPKGKALAEWLKFNFPSTQYGVVDMSVVFDNFRNPVDAMKAQIWSTANPGGTSGHARVFTVNTPAGAPAAKQCGKGVHIDAHVSQGSEVFPTSCSAKLTQADAMFAFFFMDLSSCIQRDDTPPVIPPR